MNSYLSKWKDYVLLDDQQYRSVNPDIHVHSVYTQKKRLSFRTMLQFLGPGYLVAVGYMDPGNWATDIRGGAQFGYDLLFVIVLSGLAAMFLQFLCLKLGIVSGNDLAQQCRKYFHPNVNLLLYILAEVAIIATDLAEVIGCAIALHLLFGLPLLIGVILTALDVIIILRWWDSYQRVYEFVVSILVLIVGICFSIQIAYTKPSFSEIMGGLLPSASVITNREKLYVACSILGATVMPHNLYLHSSICKSKRVKYTENNIELRELNADGDISASPVYPSEHETSTILTICYSAIDICLALFIAIIINSMMLIVAASAFHKQGKVHIEEIEAAYNSLRESVSTVAATFFALALLASGQSSTITGTIAGQIVMSGFLDMKLKPWIRRVATRLIAIIPAVITILIAGDFGLSNLLVFSQVILSFQLPFAVIPLVIFTNSDSVMTSDTGAKYRNSRILAIVSISLAAIITILNIYLLFTL